MKPTGVLAQDEMFPEGVDGVLMDMEMDEYKLCTKRNVQREMYITEITACASNMMVELAASERAIHGDFFNSFGDLFDDDDLS